MEQEKVQKNSYEGKGLLYLKYSLLKLNQDELLLRLHNLGEQ